MIFVKWMKLMVVLGICGLGLSGCRTQKTEPATKTPTTQQSPPHKQYQATAQGQRIVVTVNGQRLPAQLNRSSAARALTKRLPLTVKFRDYAGLPEKVADLDRGLPTKGMPSGHAGTKGAIGYWSPDQRLVFYWGTESYYEGIHIIGQFGQQRAQKVVRHMGNQVTVHLQKAK